MKGLAILTVPLCCLIAVLTSIQARAQTPLYVGVLEDINSTGNFTITDRLHVRVAFQKKNKDWIPMKSDFNTQDALTSVDRFYPKTVNWTVVFEGKKIGEISSKSPGPLNWYADVGKQIISTSAKDVPKITKEVSAFSYQPGPAKTRPLLLVSIPNFKDPDHWKPTALSAAEKRLAISNFRTQFPSLEQCDQPEEQPIHMVPYSDDEILFIQSYRSKNDSVVFGMRLDEARSNCGFFDDEHFFDYWYALNKDQNVRLLGSQMTPVDAADLDNSGKSAWVFHTSRGDNEDGYELFYDDLSKKAYFHWNYH